MAFEKLKKRWARERADRADRAERLRARLLERGRPVFGRYGVRRVVLFGSVLAGRSTEHSDVDLLVIPLGPAEYWPFRHDLEQALGMPVDIYTERDDPTFVEKILERGETVYAAQR